MKMFIAILIALLLLLGYLLGNMKVAFPIYVMIASFPYKSIISDNCAWLDTCFELLLLAGIIFILSENLIGKERSVLIFPTNIVILIAILSSITILFALYSRNLHFIIQTSDFRYYIGIAALSFYMYNDIRDYDKIIDICHIFIVNSLFMVCAGAIVLYSGEIKRLYAFVHINMSAAYFVVAILCCILVMILKADSRCKYIYSIPIFVNLVGLYLNRSSAGLIALISAIGIGGIYFLRIERKKLYLVLLFFAVLIGVTCVWITIQGDALDIWVIRTLMARKGYYDTSRFFIWKDAIDQFKEHWLIGIGADNFRDRLTGHNSPTHNDYLQYLVNYGILGFIAFSIYSINLYKKILTLGNIKILSVCLSVTFGMYVFMLSHNFVNWIVFWIIAQMMYCIANIEGHEDKRRRKIL